MKSIDMLDAIGGVKHEYITEKAAPAKRVSRGKVWLRYVAAAACVVLIAVGVFAVVRFGSESKQQQAAEQVNTPDPYEGVYYRAVEPVDEPIITRHGSPTAITDAFIAQNAAYIFKGVVKSMQEYELICVRGEGYPQEYVTRVECTVTDPIFGDLDKGDTIRTIYSSTSYIFNAENQVLENGKEYVFMLYKFIEAPAEEVVFDTIKLCPYRLLSSRAGFMPVDGDTVKYHIDLKPALGDLDGKADLNGTIKLIYGETDAYVANYEDVKEELIQIMEKR